MDDLRNSTFLLVDDESAIRELNARFLKDLEPSHIDEAENGAVAIEKVDQKPYRLILMDLKMPKCDGYTAIHRIKKTRPEQTILVLTSMNLAPPVLELLRYPGVDLLKKPYQKNQFLHKIKELLSHKMPVEVPIATYRHPVNLRGDLDGERVQIVELGPSAAIVSHPFTKNHMTLRVYFPKRMDPVVLETTVQLYGSDHLHLAFKDPSSEIQKLLIEFVLEALEQSRGSGQ